MRGDVAAGLDGDEVAAGGGRGNAQAPADFGHRQEPVAPDQSAQFLAATVDQVLGYAHGGTVEII
ncbi:MAG: hypothetical protein WDM96_18225 [Lacunisphaera sp.]